MKLYAPEYYKKFVCIANKCEHSCCIGWEIDIDSKTLEKYKNLENSYALNIKNSISSQGRPHFKLCSNEKCPHLDENGLCKIILNVGEGYLCTICREHPRFYNYTNIAEVGLGVSCREAARLILSSDNYDAFEEIGNIKAEEDETELNGRLERTKVYKILTSDDDYASKLERIYNEYKISVGSDSDWIDIIDSLEYLDDSHKELFLHYSSKNRPVGKDKYLERALAYFIYRHCTESYDMDDFCSRLSFCLFCERLLASLISINNAETLKEIAVIASIISEEIEYSEDNTEALMY